MKNLNQFLTTDYNKFTQKYYFTSVAKNIIKIAQLQNTDKTILDFGCGQKIFSRLLQNHKIINYDIKPEYTECESYENLNFDIVIFNQLFFYFKFNLLYDRMLWPGTKGCRKKNLKSFSWLRNIKFKKYPI